MCIYTRMINPDEKQEYKTSNVRLKKEAWAFLLKLKIDEEMKSKERVSFSNLIMLLVEKNKKYRRKIEELKNERTNNTNQN